MICGAISQYNNPEPRRGRELPVAAGEPRAHGGLLVFDYAARYGEGGGPAGWMAEGRLKTREQVVEGLASFPEALLKLFRGENTGKLVLKVDAAS